VGKGRGSTKSTKNPKGWVKNAVYYTTKALSTELKKFNAKVNMERRSRIQKKNVTECDVGSTTQGCE